MVWIYASLTACIEKFFEAFVGKGNNHRIVSLCDTYDKSKVKILKKAKPALFGMASTLICFEI